MSIYVGLAQLGPHRGCTVAALRARFPGCCVVECGPAGVIVANPERLDKDDNVLKDGKDYAVVTEGEY